MTLRTKIVLGVGSASAIAIVSLLLIPGEPGMVAQSQQRDPGNLRHYALRDLQETQAEVAKMKAHGIGMKPGRQLRHQP